MHVEATHQHHGQQLYSFDTVTDTDLVLLLAGIAAARHILRHKRYAVAGIPPLSVYYTRMLNEMGALERQIKQAANKGHIIEAETLTKTLKP